MDKKQPSGGKKNRKFKRNSRKPGASRQKERTRANKIKRIKREATKSRAYRAVGYRITHGAHGNITITEA